MVDRLCALADMPKPRWLSPTPICRTPSPPPQPAALLVCVTTGILRRLDAEELEGVLSHELSHVAIATSAVMTIASVLGVVAGLSHPLGLYFSGRGREPHVSAAVLLVSVGSPASSCTSSASCSPEPLSRYRELCADRYGLRSPASSSALASPGEDLR
jgi:heat shock protein HtpX